MQGEALTKRAAATSIPREAAIIFYFGLKT